LTNYDVRHCHKWAQLLLARQEKLNLALAATEKQDFDTAKKLLIQIVNGAYGKQVDPGMVGSLLYHLAMVTKMESETTVILEELKVPLPNVSSLLNKLYGEFEADAKELLKDKIYVIYKAKQIATSKRLTSQEKIKVVTNLKEETKKVEGCDYVEWINGTTEALDEKCPKCGEKLVLFTTAAGKKMKKCSTAGWDREKKVATGCTYVQWLKPGEDTGEEFLPPEK